MSEHLLSILTFLPLGGALIIVFVPRHKKQLLYTIALIASLLNFFFSLVLYFRFDEASALPQFVEKSPWLGKG
ncbi:MAG TPA: hypothetical protein ENF17_07990, partial [Candidatus Aminicenantes bacterium]|nr:hypothetical protein [Candidatus Aminicenantes bacterium]